MPVVGGVCCGCVLDVCVCLGGSTVSTDSTFTSSLSVSVSESPEGGFSLCSGVAGTIICCGELVTFCCLRDCCCVAYISWLSCAKFVGSFITGRPLKASVLFISVVCFSRSSGKA